ncbi:Vegetative cell wall protein gp1-like [Balamuthia mandrillaris]
MSLAAVWCWLVELWRRCWGGGVDASTRPKRMRLPEDNNTFFWDEQTQRWRSKFGEEESKASPIGPPPTSSPPFGGAPPSASFGGLPSSPLASPSFTSSASASSSPSLASASPFGAGSSRRRRQYVNSFQTDSVHDMSYASAGGVTAVFPPPSPVMLSSSSSAPSPSTSFFSPAAAPSFAPPPTTGFQPASPTFLQQPTAASPFANKYALPQQRAALEE